MQVTFASRIHSGSWTHSQNPFIIFCVSPGVGTTRLDTNIEHSDQDFLVSNQMELQVS